MTRVALRGVPRLDEGAWMLEYIRRHWIAYLIAAVITVVLGFGASYAVGIVGSTPADAHVEEGQESVASLEAEAEGQADDVASGDASDAAAFVF